MSSYLYEAYKIKQSLDSLGTSPVKEDGEIEGKDSDGLVTKFGLLPFLLIALGVVGVAGKIQRKQASAEEAARILLLPRSCC